MSKPTRNRNWPLRALVTALVLAAAAIPLNLFTGALTAAPRSTGAPDDLQTPAIRFILNPAKARELLQDLVEERSGLRPPRWLLDRFTPHAVMAALGPEGTTEESGVAWRLTINERRLGPVMDDILNRPALLRFVNESPLVARGTPTFVFEERGAVALASSFLADPAALAAYSAWPDPVESPPPTEAWTGKHLMEARATNHHGEAYLVFTSLLKAFDIHLEDFADKVSEVTFKFVQSVHFTADIVKGDSLGMVLTVTVPKGAESKLGSINLKVAIDRILGALAERLDQDHDIAFVGKSFRDENRIVYVWRLDELRRMVNLALDGNLFPPRAVTSRSGPGVRARE